MRARPTWPRRAYGFTRSKREGDDIEAINRLFAPEFRNRLDAIITFAHLSPEVIAKVVEKFVLQLEAQLADRNVTIELSDEARRWLIANGYDELMGARPMARVIQEHIKKPLADEVLFGKLKNGGHVRVVAAQGRARPRASSASNISKGPVTPKPEKLPAKRAPSRTQARRSASRSRQVRRRWPERRRAAPIRRAAARCRRCRWSKFSLPVRQGLHGACLTQTCAVSFGAAANSV